MHTCVYAYTHTTNLTTLPCRRCGPSVCVCVYIDVYMYECVCTCIHAHTHTHTANPTPSRYRRCGPSGCKRPVPISSHAC